MNCSDVHCKPTVFSGSPGPKQKPQQLELEDSIPKNSPVAGSANKIQRGLQCTGTELTQFSGPFELMDTVDSNTAGKPWGRMSVNM